MKTDAAPDFLGVRVTVDPETNTLVTEESVDTPVYGAVPPVMENDNGVPNVIVNELAAPTLSAATVTVIETVTDFPAASDTTMEAVPAFKGVMTPVAPEAATVATDTLPEATV